MFWTLELASHLEEAPWPATKDELIDYAIRSGAPIEVIENLQELEDEGEVYEGLEDIWPVTLEGKRFESLTGRKLAAFRNMNVGFVFQFHHLLPEFTALENVCIPGWIAGTAKKEVTEKASELLTTLGLKDRLENKPQQLSGGEQQRVAVARALINSPAIIMADEPTGNLDSANAKELHQLFIDLRNEFNQTFLIVTHNEELAQLSDRVLHMKDGRIIS